MIDPTTIKFSHYSRLKKPKSVFEIKKKNVLSEKLYTALLLFFNCFSFIAMKK